MVEISPDYIVAPGETIQDELEFLGMTQKDLAVRLGVTNKHVNQLIKGVVPISEKIAIGLERVLGIAASFWLKADARYQEYLARKKDEEILAEQIGWVDQFPYAAMVKNGLVPKTRDKKDKLLHLLSYFSVAAPCQFDSTQLAEVAFRQLKSSEISSGAVAAWLQAGLVACRNIETNQYSESLFRDTLKRILPLTKKESSDFIPELGYLCAEAGVAFSIVKQLPKARLCGASYWNGRKACINLSLLYKTNDHFWFSFYHEAAHILLHSKKSINVNECNTNSEEIEREADEFASDFLISPEFYNRIVSSTISERMILSFADEIGISPGIIVGRLQHDGIIPWRSNLNKLKSKFVY